MLSVSRDGWCVYCIPQLSSSQLVPRTAKRRKRHASCSRTKPHDFPASSAISTSLSQTAPLAHRSSPVYETSVARSRKRPLFKATRQCRQNARERRQTRQRQRPGRRVRVLLHLQFRLRLQRIPGSQTRQKARLDEQPKMRTPNLLPAPDARDGQRLWRRRQ